MSAHQSDRIREIKTFPSLVKYLRDELGWPVESTDFDELTFDYEPEELGIDAKTAARIQEIKQLRPLVTGQPWGIFFVKFEPKRLPVVVLRRILSQLVVKKRASSRKADQPAWHLNDLMFISNYGEGEQRQITFAQFAQQEDAADLPVLHVLGWDDADTVLHIDHVDKTLREYLSWPRDDSNVDSWRQTWSSAFVLRHKEVITTSKQLAIRLAELARRIRSRAKHVLAIETDRGQLRKLHKAFAEALIHDLTEDDFADMYAQTIAYGLLAARISRPAGLVADNIADVIPNTNPFLKELLETFLKIGGRRGGLDFDELGVNEVVETLRDANMEAVLRDFGDKNPQEDPVIHFYEGFAREYDPIDKVRRGEFYTPRPVVSFIVRSVDELLRKEFHLEDGLADTATWGDVVKSCKNFKIPLGVSPHEDFVQILDPATGTGTFLVEVIDLIHRTMTAKWKAMGYDGPKVTALWNEYVPQHLLRRLHAYELKMAPYAIAHLKIGLKLYETGYRFASDERARVYLTNTLEPPIEQTRLRVIIPALAHEAEAVNSVKRTRQFTVVIGNPPYSARSYNLTPEARALVEPYKYIEGKRLIEKGALQLEKNLNDDYVKFIRFAQVKTSGIPAVVGLITNHSFLENPTLRGMRWSLLKQFSLLRLLDLGGNVARKDKFRDENVFDISQGVAISIFASPPTNEHTSCRVARLKGTRSEKYVQLTSQVSFIEYASDASPVAPFYLFRAEDIERRREYSHGLSLTDLFPTNSTGVKTHRDEFCIDLDADHLRERIRDLVLRRLSDEEIRKRYQLLDTHGWNLIKCRKRMREDKNWESAFARILYRPFDVRFIYFSSNVIELPRMEVSRHFLKHKNIGLIFMRQVASDEPYSHFMVTRAPVDNRAFYSNRGTMSFAPLYLDDQSFEAGLFAGHKSERATANLNPECVKRIVSSFDSGCRIPENDLPEHILNYAYGVFHSQGYRVRYSEFLKIDFPRLPVTSDVELFNQLTRLGSELVTLHLMETPKLNNHITERIGRKSPEVEKVAFSDQTVWIDKSKTCGFVGVPEAVWNFHVGGYQVCEKWLKDRKGRKLTTDDIEHYQKIVVALSETIRIMAEIDKVIDQHGGWPGAFQRIG
jgi:predicted helicase